MNVEGDFRYVSLQEFKSFKNHLKSTYHRNSKFPYNSKTLINTSHRLTKQKKHKISNTNTKSKDKHSIFKNNLPEGYRERLYAFSPTGLCANYIGSNSYTILQIGNWLFCHGSPVLNTVKSYTAEEMNNIVSMYLLGIETDNNQNEKHYNKIAKSNTVSDGSSDGSEIDSNESILWDRTFGEVEIDPQRESILTKKLDSILAAYNKKNNGYININNKLHSNISSIANTKATNIAVGHTIQFAGDKGINSICNSRVWRCDVGMSRAFGDNTNEPLRKPQVLEILNDKINIIS